MPYRKEQFNIGDIIHITLKTVDNNLLFKDNDDYFRGIFTIYELNNSNPVTIQERRRARKAFKNKTYRVPDSIYFEDKRDRLVDILCFCFMPNHIHLLLKQIKNGGVTKFMSKAGVGYGGYFNRKHNRHGHVFQSRFGAVKIENDEQLKIVIAYICTNPLSLKYPEWKKIKIEEPEKAHKFLEKYKWSSYPDLMGIKNFPSVTQRDFILDVMGGPERSKNFIEYWIEYKGETRKYHNLFLED
jgi:REP element-mobilizing transposase RayT